MKVGVKGRRTEAAPSHALFPTFHSPPSLKFRCWTSLASSEGRGREGAVYKGLEKGQAGQSERVREGAGEGSRKQLKQAITKD